MIFFFVIFDGILMYMAPIVITSAGISVSTMGLIIGSSSVTGLFFDLIVCRLFRETHYRRMFLFMFIMAALYPLFLFGGTTMTFYLVAMAFWGFYYNFYNIGTLDFVGRTGAQSEHAAHFGILRVFEGTGYLIAPFVGSLLLLALHPGPLLLVAVLAPLLISFVLFMAITTLPTREEETFARVERGGVISFLGELRLWKILGGVLFPALFLTLMLNSLDAAIWTIGPLFSEQLGKDLGFSGGLAMTAYAFPPLFVGLFVGVIARRYGMRRTAQWAIILGALFLVGVGAIGTSLCAIFLLFGTSCALALGWPTVNALYTEYVDRTPLYRKEVETLQDLFTNAGDIVGPIAGGYMAEYLGGSHAFVALGGSGLVAIVVLFVLRRKKPEETLAA
jgi:MFS family permease